MADPDPTNATTAYGGLGINRPLVTPTPAATPIPAQDSATPRKVTDPLPNQSPSELGYVAPQEDNSVTKPLPDNQAVPKTTSLTTSGLMWRGGQTVGDIYQKGIDALPDQPPQTTAPAIPTGDRLAYIKSLTTPQLQDLFSKTGNSDIDNDWKADFFGKRVREENSQVTYNNRGPMVSDDMAGTVANLGSKVLSGAKDAIPNLINGTLDLGKAVGTTGDSALQWLGSQPVSAYRADLTQKHEQHLIGDDQFNQGMSDLDEIEKINAELETKGTVTGLGTAVPDYGDNQGVSSLDELRNKLARKTALYYHADSDFARHEASKGFQQMMMGYELTGDHLNKIGDAIKAANETFDSGKYFTGYNMMGNWDNDKIKQFFLDRQKVNLPLQQHSQGLPYTPGPEATPTTAGGLNPRQPGTSAPLSYAGMVKSLSDFLSPSEQKIQSFNKWDIDWRREAGLLPSYAEYATPEQLAKEGNPIDPEKVNAISSVGDAVAATLLTEGTPLGKAFEDLAPNVLRKFGWTLDEPSRIAGSVSLKKLQWVTLAADFLRGHLDPSAYFNQFATDLTLHGLEYANSKWGHYMGDAFEDAALQNYKGGGIFWQGTGRMMRGTMDGIAKSFPYAALTSAGSPEQFWDNWTSLAPVHMVIGAPRNVAGFAGGALGDFLWARKGQIPGLDLDPFHPADIAREDPNLVQQSHDTLQDLRKTDPTAYGLAVTAQRWFRGNTDIFFVDKKTIADYQSRFGAAGYSNPRGFFVDPSRTGTGRAAAFIDKDDIRTALPHEGVGHSIYWLMDDDLKKRMADETLKYNDPDKFIENYTGHKGVTYDSLPDTPDGSHPLGLSKQLIREEMAVEELGRYYNGGAISDFYKDKPGLNRAMRESVGQLFQRVGLPTQTYESSSEFGVHPHFGTLTLTDKLWRDAAKNKLQNRDVREDWLGGWPGQGETWLDKRAQLRAAKDAAKAGANVPPPPEPPHPFMPTGGVWSPLPTGVTIPPRIPGKYLHEGNVRNIPPDIALRQHPITGEYEFRSQEKPAPPESEPTPPPIPKAPKPGPAPPKPPPPAPPPAPAPEEVPPPPKEETVPPPPKEAVPDPKSQEFHDAVEKMINENPGMSQSEAREKVSGQQKPTLEETGEEPGVHYMPRPRIRLTIKGKKVPSAAARRAPGAPTDPSVYRFPQHIWTPETWLRGTRIAQAIAQPGTVESQQGKEPYPGIPYLPPEAPGKK